MVTKLFHLGDVLSITTGLLLSPRHIDGVHDIVGFMTGHEAISHELGSAAVSCKEFLLEQHPQLAAIDLNVIDKDKVDAALADLCATYGNELLVASLPPHRQPQPQGFAGHQSSPAEKDPSSEGADGNEVESAF